MTPLTRFVVTQIQLALPVCGLDALHQCNFLFSLTTVPCVRSLPWFHTSLACHRNRRIMYIYRAWWFYVSPLKIGVPSFVQIKLQESFIFPYIFYSFLLAWMHIHIVVLVHNARWINNVKTGIKKNGGKSQFARPIYINPHINALFYNWLDCWSFNFHGGDVWINMIYYQQRVEDGGRTCSLRSDPVVAGRKGGKVTEIQPVKIPSVIYRERGGCMVWGPWNIVGCWRVEMEPPVMWKRYADFPRKQPRGLTARQWCMHDMMVLPWRENHGLSAARPSRSFPGMLFCLHM